MTNKIDTNINSGTESGTIQEKYTDSFRLFIIELKIGVYDFTLKWFKSTLHNCKQQVCINKTL